MTVHSKTRASVKLGILLGQSGDAMAGGVASSDWGVGGGWGVGGYCYKFPT